MPEQLDQPLPQRHSPWTRLTGQSRGRSDTAGRVAEAIARFSGTPTFLIWLSLFVVVWMGWNTFGPQALRFDKASLGFTALTLVLSLQASYSAPLILLAQNRQDDRDRVTAEQDRQRAESNLQDTEYLTREIASLRLAVNDVATRDFVRGELRDLLEDILAEERRSREEIVGEIVEELSEDDEREDAEREDGGTAGEADGGATGQACEAGGGATGTTGTTGVGAPDAAVASGVEGH